MEMGSHRARGDSKVLRDLSMPPALQVVKEHDLSTYLRKPRERRSQPFLKFCVFRRFLGRAAPRRGGLGDGVRNPQNLATNQVASSVPDDRQKPTGESVGSAAIVESLEGDHKRLLNGVLGIVMATRNRKADCIGRAHVPAHENPEGLAIAGPRPPDQILVRCAFYFIH